LKSSNIGYLGKMEEFLKNVIFQTHSFIKLTKKTQIKFPIRSKKISIKQEICLIQFFYLTSKHQSRDLLKVRSKYFDIQLTHFLRLSASSKNDQEKKKKSIMVRHVLEILF
jgi:hypothetical protein